MAAITAIAGLLPLYMPQKINTERLTQFGSGVILSAAFIVVIPEGYEQIGEKWSLLAGIAVVLGFLLMITIDKLFYDDGSASETLTTSNYTMPSIKSPKTWFSNMNVLTIGLVIHAAADGIALGASTGSESTSLEFLVFVSILIHKAPTALSLASVLMSMHNYAKANIFRDMILFSAAAPVLAIFVGGLVALFRVTTSSNLFPGFCLALSGGTFVYVASHVLNEHANINKNNFVKSLALVLCGAVLPACASFLPD